MEHTRDLAVSILNDTTVCSDANKKAECLQQLTELLVRKEPGLLAEFIPEMAMLQVDMSPLVRSSFATFLGNSSAVAPQSGTLKQIAESLTAFLRDTSPMVLKAALNASASLLRAGLVMLGQKGSDPDVLSMWEAVRAAQQAALDLLSKANLQEGVRLNAVKFMEILIMLFMDSTAPAPAGVDIPPQQLPRLPQAAQLNTEASNALKMLLDQIRPEHAKKLGHGPVVITAVKSAGVVATHRPVMMGKILPPLLLLVKETPVDQLQGGYMSSESKAARDPGSRGSQLSVGDALRNALVSVLRSRHSQSLPWKDRLFEALEKLGATAAAEAADKFIKRQEYKDKQAHASQRQRSRDSGPSSPSLPDPKRQRTDSGPLPAVPLPAPGQQTLPAPPHFPAHLGPPQRAANPPGAYPTQQPNVQHVGHQPQQRAALYAAPQQPQALPLYAPQALPAHLPMSLPPPPQDPGFLANQPPPTPAEDLMQLHLMLPALLAHPDGNIVNDFLEKIAGSNPAMLADLVMYLMLFSPIPTVEEVAQRLQGTGAPATPPHTSVAAETQAAAPAGATTPVPPDVQQQQGVKSKRHLPAGRPLVPPEARASTSALTGQSQQPSQAVPSSSTVPPAIINAVKTGAPCVPPLQLAAEKIHQLRAGHFKRLANSSHDDTITPLWMQIIPRLAASGSAKNYKALATPGSGAKDDAVRVAAAAQKASADLNNAAFKQAWATARLPGGDLTFTIEWLNALLTEQCIETLSARAKAARHGEPGGSLPGSQSQVRDVSMGGADTSQPSADGPSSSAVPSGDGSSGSQRSRNAGNEAAASQLPPTAPNDTVKVDQQQQEEDLATVQPVQLTGTKYERALVALLNKFRDMCKSCVEYDEHGNLLPAKFDLVRNLLVEAPALTSPGCINFMKGLLVEGEPAARVAMAVARDNVLTLPKLRMDFLQFILEAAYNVDTRVRSMAVRCLVNQLTMTLGGILATHIRTAAVQALTKLLQPPSESDMQVMVEGEGDEDQVLLAEWSTEQAARYCDLYVNLCMRYPDMLTGLMETFTKASDPVCQALMTSSESLARALGHSCPELVDFVKHPIPGSEPLVHHMLDALMSHLLPSEAMMEACRERAAVDPAILVPVLPALDKAEVVEKLPQLLQVESINLKGLYAKLVKNSPVFGDAMFQPAELLCVLHAFDPVNYGISVKALIPALDAAIHAPDLFPQHVITQAIDRMEQEPVQPLLFMRTVIQAIKALPKIKPHIIRTLRNLIGKSIWLDQSQWRGFLLLVADQGKPFFPIMLELPLPVLDQVMQNSMIPGDPFHGKAYSLATWALTSEYRPRMMATQVAMFERCKADQEADEAQLLAALGTALGEGDMKLDPSIKQEDGDMKDEEGLVKDEDMQDLQQDQGMAAEEGEGGNAPVDDRELDEFDLDFGALEGDEGGSEHEGEEDGGGGNDAAVTGTEGGGVNDSVGDQTMTDA